MTLLSYPEFLVRNQVYDPNTLSYVAMTQPSGGGGGDATAAHQVVEDAALAAIKIATEGTQLSAFQIASGMVVDGVGGTPDLRLSISGDTYDVNHTHRPIPLGDLGRSIPVEGVVNGIALPVSANRINMIWASGSVNTNGNNLLVTRSVAGNTIRVHYASYNPSAAVECAFRFTTTGTKFLRNSLLVGGSVIAKDFGDFRFVEGNGDEALYLNLSAAIDTIWNVLYTEGTS